MKRIEAISIRCAIIFIVCSGIFFISDIGQAAEGKYPMKVEIIDKHQARYDAPENTLAAMISSLIKKDLVWYYETLTEETAAKDKKDFQEGAIDPRKKFDLVKGTKADFIVDKLPYEDGILLICESHGEDGSVMRGPSIFIKENGLWKATFEFSSDEKLWDYIDYIKPEEILSSTTIIRPNRWNLNWYNWIKEHIEEKKWIRRFAERVCILCMISNLKDNEGNPHSVEEIAPEKFLLNYLVHPQPWRFGQGEKMALIFDLRENRDLNKMRGLKDWHDGSKFSKKFNGPVMLVKFNKFKAMETLLEMIHGEEYDIIVSGELKNGKRFKGSARITITGWEAEHRWDLKEGALPICYFFYQQLPSRCCGNIEDVTEEDILQ
jgi:hypothetical protein